MRLKEEEESGKKKCGRRKAMEESNNTIDPIYVEVEDTDPLRQGDIFYNVPRVLGIDVNSLFTRIEDSEKEVAREGTEEIEMAMREKSWKNKEVKDPLEVLLHVESVYAIIMTQDCDIQRDGYITLFKLVVSRYQRDVKSLKKAFDKFRVDFEGVGGMFLPAPEQEEKRKKFERNMKVDFTQITHLMGEDLTLLKKYRMFSLNEMALEHFRHKIEQFFLRYAVDRHYVLSQEEFSSFLERGISKEGIGKYFTREDLRSYYKMKKLPDEAYEKDYIKFFIKDERGEEDKKGWETIAKEIEAEIKGMRIGKREIEILCKLSKWKKEECIERLGNRAEERSEKWKNIREYLSKEKIWKCKAD